jgi:hypothetical protein
VQRSGWEALRATKSLLTIAISGPFPDLELLSGNADLSSLDLAATLTVGPEIAPFRRLRNLRLGPMVDVDEGFLLAVRELPEIRQLRARVKCDTNLQWVPRNVHQLDLTETGAVTLEGIPSSIDMLSISNAPKLEDISRLSDLRELRWLTLGRLPSLKDTGPLLELPKYCHLTVNEALSRALPDELLEARKVRIFSIGTSSHHPTAAYD